MPGMKPRTPTRRNVAPTTMAEVRTSLAARSLSWSMLVGWVLSKDIRDSSKRGEGTVLIPDTRSYGFDAWMGQRPRPRTRRTRWWARAARAAFIPGAPWTPPPGWADADAR